jgi:large subunit ribosomal protein L15
MRLPKLRGGNDSRKTQYSVVHLADLEKLAQSGTSDITIDTLFAAGIIRGKNSLVKLLSGGEISSSVKLSVHAASASAQKALEKAGGTLTIVE